MNKRKWLLFLGIGILAAALWWLNKQHLQLAPKDVKNWVLQFGMLAPFVFFSYLFSARLFSSRLRSFLWRQVWHSAVSLGRFMPSLERQPGQQALS